MFDCIYALLLQPPMPSFKLPKIGRLFNERYMYIAHSMDEEKRRYVYPLGSTNSLVWKYQFAKKNKTIEGVKEICML